jgi:hypothetical protein
MQLDLRVQLNLGNPLQRLSQNSSFVFQLPRVGNVLVVTTTAPLKIGTNRFHLLR